MGGGTYPQPQSGRIVGIAEKIGGAWGVPGHLGQTNYAEIRILVTKYKIAYTSKPNKIKNTNYMPCI